MSREETLEKKLCLSLCISSKCEQLDGICIESSSENCEELRSGVSSDTSPNISLILDDTQILIEEVAGVEPDLATTTEESESD